ncbi:hypothetical protein [Acidisoma cladoniae]|uniref:hypothetical protein n=1 Tax=Acidisoma cladoniae TaxID=3040935 RepID=UPI002550284E|nr:hypothetical protein [Acidisoma sp. PAMC 29798]
MHETPREAGRTDAAPHFHTVVWLDHHEARIIHFSMTAADEEVARPVDAPRHLHIKSGSASGTHIRSDPAFYNDVGKAMDGAHAVLLVGPSTAKTEFMTYMRDHAHLTADRIVGVRVLAQITDPQLLAYGRRFFSENDRTTPQTR